MNCLEHSLKITKQLKENKLKVTSIRLSLLDLFEHANKPLSVKEIREELSRGELSKIDKVTLYRTIDTLENLSLLKKVQLNGRQTFFEINSTHHHHHLVCRNCNKIIDLPGCKIAISDTNLLENTGFAKITDHSLEFFGICNACFT